MNYGELLYQAHENNKNAEKKVVPCYKTTYAPLKRVVKPISKVSSENVKKFLARREAEEKAKELEARKKKQELLALRNQDKKAQKRVQVMLKRTKSANKSVMDDAVDNVNTADTLQGPMQCDEDDYGYVSQEASAFYAKLMNKYANIPETPLFSPQMKVVKDLSATKDRVKAALRKEEEEAELPHKRKRRSAVKDAEDVGKSETTTLEDNFENADNKNKLGNINSMDKKIIKKPKRPMPPPLNFDEILKLAEIKQHQPVVIDFVQVPKEPERLMTEKEKAEYLREEERKKMKERRASGNVKDQVYFKKSHQEIESDKQKTNNNASLKGVSKKSLINRDSPDVQKFRSSCHNDKETSRKEIPSIKKDKCLEVQIHNSKLSKDNNKIDKKEKSKNIESKVLDIDREIELLKKTKMNLLTQSKQNKPNYVKQEFSKSMKTNNIQSNNMEVNNFGGKPQTNRQNHIMSKQPKTLASKAMQQPPMHSSFDALKLKSPLTKKKIAKRRIDSDSEYDSELDDFIDDGPLGGEEDYSKHISEIFGYDKSKYALNEDDGIDECMESSFAQQMREEYVSTKIGIMEDLEDIRKEQEEKRRFKEHHKNRRLQNN